MNSRRATPLPIVSAAVIVLAGTAAVAFHLVSVLSDPVLSAGIVSRGLWQRAVLVLRGEIHINGNAEIADVPLWPIVAGIAGISLLAWLAGAAWISRRRGLEYAAALRLWGRNGWLWWLLPVAWEIFGTLSDLAGSSPWQALQQATLPVWHSLLWAGWLTTFVMLARRPASAACSPGARSEQSGRIPRVVWTALLLYFACFGAMNWLLYESLLLPHGDSAMYEEHIWNLLHGKGFRSYLDGGRLFLGEHVQVIHLLSMPLYVLWPSQILLELCQSACLALGAIPVYRIARRHTACSGAAALLAIAYLLYFPMQYLDIAATLKTFRPNSFEIPLFLCALDALERRRYPAFLGWLGMTLLCQEDAAMIIAPLGVWIAMRQSPGAKDADSDTDSAGRRRLVCLGLGLALFGAAYVVMVVKVVLPWFRNGADVHFAQYFKGLGETSGEIVVNVLSHPQILLGRWFNVESFLFAVQLLAPLGFLSLLSPGRLAVAAPLFGILCLSEMTNTAVHHFHAPLVPILIWAAAAGLARVEPLYSQVTAWRHRRGRAAVTDDERRRIPAEDFLATGKSLPAIQSAEQRATSGSTRPVAQARPPLVAASVWVALCSFLTGVPVTFSPLGIDFWDPYSSKFWKSLYVPGERARRFPAVLELVPPESRVASTDYIHPRFTHYARSYDYSLYRTVVPDDAEYIVIDTRHRDSGIKLPEEVQEYRQHPERWELLDDKTGGYFLVLKRSR